MPSSSPKTKMLLDHSAEGSLEETCKCSSSETRLNHFNCNVQMEGTFVLVLRLTYDRLVFIISQFYITGFWESCSAPFQSKVRCKFKSLSRGFQSSSVWFCFQRDRMHPQNQLHGLRWETGPNSRGMIENRSINYFLLIPKHMSTSNLLIWFWHEASSIWVLVLCYQLDSALKRKCS